MRKISCLLLIASMFYVGSAAAQVKPKILIIFDTSGSMFENSAGVWQLGDGSPLCSNIDQSARIYQLKQALLEVLQGMGANEIEFGLASFPQHLNTGMTPQCSTQPSCSAQPPNACGGHYYLTDAQDSENYPYRNWYQNVAIPLAQQYLYRNGCKLSTHDPFTQQTASCGSTNCPWYDAYKKEILRVPFAGSTPEQVMFYFDQQEDPGPVSGSTLSNPEIRPIVNSFTPLGKSLFYAHGYFDKEVIPGIPVAEKPCQKLAIALFTDGVETCNPGEVRPDEWPPDYDDPYLPTIWAGNLYNSLGVVTHTVAMDLPPNVQTLVGDIANAGHGTAYNVTGTTAALKQAFLSIIAQAQPPSEICNGLDDDCDNLVDEDFPLLGQPCNNGKLGICYRDGNYICSGDQQGVVCDAADGGTGTAEICDGLDNNCNGQIDEGLVCYCSPEICNGKDDDCDTLIDEDIPSVPCGLAVGECKPGMTVCEDGYLKCKDATGPSQEVCNNKDDDCDGVVDGMGQACYPENTEGCDLESGVCKGLCKLGTQICTAGVWGACDGAVTPAEEICDGLDNNCDGNTDEDALCPSGSVCVNGLCTQKCSIGEFGCPVGQLCVDDWCVPDPCDQSQCDLEHPGWVCRAGECIDACAGVECGANETCYRGACLDTTCYTKGCPEGQVCVQKVCKPDPCDPTKVKCGSNEFCSNGVCIQTCDTIFCPEGEICKVLKVGSQLETQCVKDPCSTMSCSSGKVCQDGKCINNPCGGVFCERGKVCDKSTCVENLCEVTRCPPGYKCSLGNCTPQNVERTAEILATGGGGLSCQLSPSHQGEGVLSLLLLTLLFRLSRRFRRN